MTPYRRNNTELKAGGEQQAHPSPPLVNDSHRFLLFLPNILRKIRKPLGKEHPGHRMIAVDVVLLLAHTSKGLFGENHNLLHLRWRDV